MMQGADKRAVVTVTRKELNFDREVFAETPSYLPVYAAKFILVELIWDLEVPGPPTMWGIDRRQTALGPHDLDAVVAARIRAAFPQAEPFRGEIVKTVRYTHVCDEADGLGTTRR